MATRINHDKVNAFRRMRGQERAERDAALTVDRHGAKFLRTNAADTLRRMLALEAWPGFCAPAWWAAERARVEAGEVHRGLLCTLGKLEVALGAVQLKPYEIAISAARKRHRKARAAGRGYSATSFQEGLARLDAVQASRPLKPPTKKDAP